MKGYGTSFAAWTARDAEDKTGGDRKIRHGHSGVAGRKFVFNTAEPCPNALVPSLRKRHSGEVLLFSGARITHGSHQYTRCVAVSRPRRSVTLRYQLAETVAH